MTSNDVPSPCPEVSSERSPVVKAFVGPKVAQREGGGPRARWLGMDSASRVVQLSIASRECLVDLVSCLGRESRSV
jgi:hypothetical protein